MNVDLELNSPAMDEESTQAAEPVLDATEPAPSADETQSIYAWSQDGDETMVMQRRSWKFPVALASLAAVAAVATGLILLWPANKPALPAQTSKVAGSASPTRTPELAMTAGDKRFIDSLAAYGPRNFNTSNTQQMSDYIAVGRATCEILKMGNSMPETVELMTPKVPGMAVRPGGVSVFVNDAVTAYCPQYATSQ